MLRAILVSVYLRETFKPSISTSHSDVFLAPFALRCGRCMGGLYARSRAVCFGLVMVR